MKNPWMTLLILVALSLAGCSPAKDSATGATPTGATQAAPQVAFKRDAVTRYAAEFRLQFSGASSWLYHLQMRRAPEQREITLHLEGLDATQNPGDVRLLSDGAQSWMIGAGTDNECVQFPNNRGLDPTFLFPESLIDLNSLGSALQLVGQAQANDIPEVGQVVLQHYRAEGVSSAGWKNVTVDFWKDDSNDMLYRYSVEADGEDSFFSAGAGHLSATYGVTGLGDQPFEPVSGCEIGVKLPESAAGLVRLPGMVSFESVEGVGAMQQFYQMVMVQENWSEAQPPQQQNGATVLSYQRDGKDVQISIESVEAGSKVTLLFLEK